MSNSIEEQLIDTLSSEYDKVATMEDGSPEKRDTMANIERLQKLYNELAKNADDMDMTRKRIELDDKKSSAEIELKREQVRNDKEKNRLDFGKGIVSGLMWSTLASVIMNFEKEGVVRTKAMSILMNKFRF